MSFQNAKSGRLHINISLTLGNVYDLDLKRNEREIRDVCEQARGEVRPSPKSASTCAYRIASTAQPGRLPGYGQRGVVELLARTHELSQQVPPDQVSSQVSLRE